MLSEKAPLLKRTLDRLRGREEWGLNVYTDWEKFVTPFADSAESTVDTARPGQAYLLKKKTEAARTAQAKQEFDV